MKCKKCGHEHFRVVAEAIGHDAELTVYGSLSGNDYKVDDREVDGSFYLEGFSLKCSNCGNIVKVKSTDEEYEDLVIKVEQQL